MSQTPTNSNFYKGAFWATATVLLLFMGFLLVVILPELNEERHKRQVLQNTLTELEHQAEIVNAKRENSQEILNAIQASGQKEEVSEDDAVLKGEPDENGVYQGHIIETE